MRWSSSFLCFVIFCFVQHSRRHRGFSFCSCFAYNGGVIRVAYRSRQRVSFGVLLFRFFGCILATYIVYRLHVARHNTQCSHTFIIKIAFQENHRSSIKVFKIDCRRTAIKAQRDWSNLERENTKV